MKKIIKFITYISASLAVMVCTGIYASAQEPLKDTLPESAYNLQVPKHVINIYSSFVPYVLFSIIAFGMLFVTYRYWADNRQDQHDFTNHHLQH